MGIFEHFPYTNFHELNAGWLVQMMKELDQAMETFKATESLRFADPIIWDITTQYEKSTIVLDSTGNAYLSLQPVPTGIQLNNNEYWLEIFNFTDYTRTANQNLTVNVETNTTRATAAYQVDDWIIWNDVLYKATSPIAIDDTLIVSPAAGANLIHFTVEDFIKAFMTWATNTIQQYKNDIDASELAYKNAIDLSEQAFTDHLQAQFDLAIAGATVDSEVILARIGLTGNTFTTLAQSIQTQIEEVYDFNMGKLHFVIGGMQGDDGHYISLTNRAIPALKFPLYYSDAIEFTDTSNTYQYRISATDEKLYVASNMVLTPWTTNALTVLSTGPDTKPWGSIIVKRNDDADITAAELETLSNSFIIHSRFNRFIGNGNNEHMPSADLNDLLSAGWYGWRGSFVVINAPTDFSGAGNLHVFSYSYNASDIGNMYEQILTDSKGHAWFRIMQIIYPSTVSVYADWRMIAGPDVLLSRGRITHLPSNDLDDIQESGWYGWGSSDTVVNLPDGFSGPGSLHCFSNNFNSESDYLFTQQFLYDIESNCWMRVVMYDYNNHTTGVWREWRLISGVKVIEAIPAIEGKVVAILGDSISTVDQVNWQDVPEIEITSDDVGVTLSAYLTFFDVQNGLTINGYTYTSDEIGTEITFTPVAADVGKKVGLARKYNPNTINPWWKVLMKYAAFTPIPVNWSGASMSSHEKDTDMFKTSYAWHDAQIRKCGIRTPGTMTRTAPDYIIICRGNNDFSHAPYAKLTADYYDNYNWQYPATDFDGTNYGYKEAIALTIKKLRAAYPDAKIMLCTIQEIHRINYTHFPVNNGTDNVEQYNNAIREAANFYGCGLIDIAKCGVTFENMADYCRDNPPVHPNQAGHNLIALKAAADINAQYR